VQVRTADEQVRQIVARLNHAPTRLATAAERALLTILDGGCQAPLGAFASWTDASALSLDAIVLNDDGTRLLRATAGQTVETADDAHALASRIAMLLDDQGASAILAACRQKWASETRPSVGELA
jgi:hydroxymethylbilane synthase